MPEEITPEALDMQRKADELERQIVRFTNIDSETFTLPFRGITISVMAGHSYVGRLPECDHLATHLARKIISRKKKAEIPAEKLGNLWTDKEIFEMKEKILSEVGTEDQSSTTPEEARRRDMEQLTKKFEPKEDTEGGLNKNNPVIVSKKDVISDLEKRGVKVDVSKSREELLAQLMEVEAKGIEPSLE